MTSRSAARPALAILALVVALTACTPAGRSPDSAASPEGGVSSRSEASATTPTTAPAPTERRPNLLVIEADDMRADELRRMPRTRRLIAERGLTFPNSFAPNPLCCPSRASFLTGLNSHRHGVLSELEPYGFEAFDDSDTLATRLQQAGYRTALVGKYLNGYGTRPRHDGAGDSLLYVPPGWTQWYGASDRVWAQGTWPGGNTYNYFHLTSNVNGALQTWPGRYSTDVTAEQTREVLTGFAAHPSRPWFVWWTPIAPHHGAPVEPDDPGTVHRQDGFPVPWVTPARPDRVKGRFDAEITRPPAPRRAWDEADVSDKPAYLRRTPPVSPREDQVLVEVTRQRAETLSVLDAQIARTLRHLDRLGESARTLVVFTSDNGYYLGEHRKRQGKINLHEPSVRVPLLVRGPGVPEGIRYDPASTVDLATTVAAYAGAPLDDPDGVDLGPVIRQGDRGWDRPILLEGRMPEPTYTLAGDLSREMDGLNTMGLRTARWKVVRYATGEAEVYDLENDPLELESLPPDGPRRDLVRRLLRLSQRYADCAGAECSRPLPERFRVNPEENKAITLAQDAAAAR